MMNASVAEAKPVETEKLTVKAWLVVGLLCVVGCLNYLDRVMITTMRTSIIHSIPMSDAQFGLLTSVFLWVYGLLSPIAGFMADRFTRSRVIIFSLFIWSCVTFITSQATTFQGLLISRAMMGVSEACYLPAAVALIADYHKGRTRSMANGLHMGGIMVGQSLGFLGAWIAEAYNWNYAFAIFGSVGMAYAVILFFTLKDAKKQEHKEFIAAEKVKFTSGISILFKERGFVYLFLFWGLIGIVGWMILGWLPTYYKEHFNLSQTKAGVYATGYMYPFSLIGVILGGIIADKWSKTNRYARILAPLIGLCIAAPAVFMASSTDVVYITVAGFIVYALTRSFSDTNLMPVLCMVADERYRATGYGVLNMFSCIVGGIGLYASGALRDAHVNMALLFKIAALSMILCVALLYFVKKDVQRTTKDNQV